ncbi:MAG: methylase, partial [Bacilli bacterium]
KPDLLNSLSYEKILEVLNIDNNEIQLNKIYNQDCISFIDKMIENNILVDAIITDPPYNVSRKNNFKTIGRNGIDFGE